MNRSYLKWIALAGALLAPAPGYAQAPQASCTRESLKALTDRYIDVQTKGARAVGANYLLSSVLGGYVENFDVISSARLIDKPMQIDYRRSLLDTGICETFTEVIVSDDESKPYAVGTRAHQKFRGEVESMWTTSGYWGFDIDTYQKAWTTEAWGPIPEDRRATRKALESIANAYMDALLEGKADVEPWGLPCKRTAADGSCQVGLPINAVNIANRHFVIDESIGAVVVLCTLGAAPASGRIRTPDAHVFRVENGKIRFVHALMHLPQADVPNQGQRPAAAK